MIEAAPPSDPMLLVAPFAPTELDRAIDNLTVATIELQQLRRHSRQGYAFDAQAQESLARVETQLHKLAHSLTALRV